MEVFDLELNIHIEILRSYFYTDIITIICQYAFWTCSACQRTRWPRCRQFQKCTQLFCIAKRRAPKAAMHGRWNQLWGSDDYVTILANIKRAQETCSRWINDHTRLDYATIRRLYRIAASELQLHWLSLRRPYRHMILSRSHLSRSQAKAVFHEHMKTQRQLFSARIDALLGFESQNIQTDSIVNGIVVSTSKSR